MKKKFALLLSLLLAFGMLFGCGANQEPADDSEDQNMTQKDTQDENASLSDWDGEWNSIVYWYDDEEVRKGLGDDADSKIAEKDKGAHTDFAKIKVEADHVTFMDRDGKELAKSEYKFLEKKVKGEGEHSEWDIFEATGDVDSKYKVIALMPIHGEEGDLTHFHARYGATADEALSDDSWWPVIASPETTAEQAIGEIETLD